MAKMIVLYGRPDDTDAFERYYADHHLPFASERMGGVTDAENLTVIGAPGNHQPELYRISAMTFPDAATMRTAVDSDGGRAVIADLDNFATGGATVVLADD